MSTLSRSAATLAATALFGMLVACGPFLRNETDPLPAPGAPLAPTGLKVEGSVTRVLTWEPVERATSYDVRYSRRNYAWNDPNEWDPWIVVHEASTGSGYRLRAMGRSERRFAVRARNEKGPGAWSATVEHTPARKGRDR